MPLDAIEAGAHAVGLARGASVLEVGAGTGALTVTLVDAGFDVTALEPGSALRAHAATRAPAARLVASTFEEYEPGGGRFDALFSANALHWVDPDVAYVKAAEVAGAVVLVWDIAYPADAGLLRRLQDEVMVPRGSEFPSDDAAVRSWFDADTAGGREELAASGRFEEPWWHTFERMLEYTPARYLSLIRSLGAVASQPQDVRDEVTEALRAVLPAEPFPVTDLVYVVAARARGG